MSNKQRKYSVPKTKTEDDDHEMTPDFYPWPSFPHDHPLLHNNRRVPNNHLARSIPTTYIINKVKHLKFKKNYENKYQSGQFSDSLKVG